MAELGLRTLSAGDPTAAGGRATIRRDFSGASMKKVAIGIAAIAALIGTRAVAADMAVKAPPPPEPVTAPFGWAGFYIGANGGYGWKDPTVIFSPNDVESQFSTCGGGNGGTCAPPASFSIDGGFGGFQGGYSWQFNQQWVAGIESDFDWSGIKGAGTSNFILGSNTVPTPSNFAVSQSIEWFGTVRARLGYLAADNLLLFASGGLAYGRVKESVSLNSQPGANHEFAPFGYGCVAGANCFVGGNATTELGWAAGSGIEYALSSNVSVRAEYLYVSLGRSAVDVVAQSPFTQPNAASFTAAFSRAAINTVRGGVNWRFN